MGSHFDTFLIVFVDVLNFVQCNAIGHDSNHDDKKYFRSFDIFWLKMKTYEFFSQ